MHARTLRRLSGQANGFQRTEGAAVRKVKKHSRSAQSSAPKGLRLQRITSHACLVCVSTQSSHTVVCRQWLAPFAFQGAASAAESQWSARWACLLQAWSSARGERRGGGLRCRLGGGSG